MHRSLAFAVVVVSCLLTGCAQNYNQLYAGSRRPKNETIRLGVAGRIIQQFDGRVPQIQNPNWACEILPGEHTMVVQGGEVLRNQYGQVMFRNILEVPVALRFSARLGQYYAVIFGSPDRPHITKWGSITEEGLRGTYRTAYINEWAGESSLFGEPRRVDH